MTYSLFLLLFLALPTALLLIALRGRIARHNRIALGLVNALAFVYTTPWDNFAAYKKLWTFAPAFVWGRPLWFGYLPLEEYLFYFAEAVFVCVTMLVLSRVRWLRVAPPPPLPSVFHCAVAGESMPTGEPLPTAYPREVSLRSGTLTAGGAGRQLRGEGNHAVR